MAGTIQNELPPHAPYASVGGGCFWCVEAEFRRLPGVIYTRSGYEGGRVDNPSYEDVCTGRTGHAEATEIYFDPKRITYRELLDHFLTLAHDPTDLNGQGPDRGTQYRSVIFYHDDDQKAQAQAAIAAAQDLWPRPIVTTLEPQAHFWPAEDYHQQYYEKYEEKRGVPHHNMMIKRQKWARQNARTT